LKLYLGCAYFGAIPFGILGFVKYNGMYAEEFVIAWIKSEILTPNVLFFEPENIYYEMLKEDYKKLEMEGMKIDKSKKKKRKSKSA